MEEKEKEEIKFDLIPDYNCRFYENILPEQNEVVMIQIDNVQETGAYVKLLEYDNREGIIVYSEITRKRTKSITKLVRVGKKQPAVVMNIDKEKGFMDLSKRKVNAQEALVCEERYNKSKQVHSILRKVAYDSNKTLIELYEMVGWPLYKEFGHALDALKAAVKDSEAILKHTTISPEVKEVLLKEIQLRMAPQMQKITAKFEITCFAYEGILAIRHALLITQKEMSSKTCPLQFRLIAPPLYECYSSTLEKKKGIQLMNDALKKVEREIKAKGGKYQLKDEPKTISGKDSKELEKILEGFEELEIASSEDEEEQEGMGVDIDFDNVPNGKMEGMAEGRSPSPKGKSGSPKEEVKEQPENTKQEKNAPEEEIKEPNLEEEATTAENTT